MNKDLQKRIASLRKYSAEMEACAKRDYDGEDYKAAIREIGTYQGVDLALATLLPEIEKITAREKLLVEALKKLRRYDCFFYPGEQGQGAGAYMGHSERGEYVCFEHIASIIAAYENEGGAGE